MDDARHRVTVVLDPDIKEAVERQAKSERSTLSAICRRVLADWAQARRAPVREAAA